MKHNIIMIKLLVLAMAVPAWGQSTLETVLSSVEKNNKGLAERRQYWEARKMEYKTGLTLPDPAIQGQFLFGAPASAGNQTDFFAVQPFDFPTTYRKRKDLAAEQGAVANSELAARRQEVLLDAKLVCLELVYRNKLAAQYQKRKEALENLLAGFQRKMDTGEGGVLDVNKTKLQLLEISQLRQENGIGIQKLGNRLTGLNGGAAISFQDTVYPPLEEVKPFDVVIKEYESASPKRQMLEQEKRIAEKQLELAKAWRLPKFEAGYHYQGILGQRFSGVHAGLTLPVWEHKYRTEAQQAQVLHAGLRLQSHLNEHFFEIKEMYERQAALRRSLDEFESAIASVNNPELLDKALRLGEITTFEYFLEMSLYQNAVLHFLKTEWNYQAAVAELMRYRL